MYGRNKCTLFEFIETEKLAFKYAYIAFLIRRTMNGKTSTFYFRLIEIRIIFLIPIYGHLTAFNRFLKEQISFSLSKLYQVCWLELSFLPNFYLMMFSIFGNNCNLCLSMFRLLGMIKKKTPSGITDVVVTLLWTQITNLGLSFFIFRSDQNIENNFLSLPRSFDF